MAYTCTSEPIVVGEDGNLFYVSGSFQCYSIPNNLIGTKSGSDTSWAFKNIISSVEKFDFSSATHLKYIGDYSFYKCEKVISFDLSYCKELTYIGYSAFGECKNAQSIILPSGSHLTNLKGGCFYQCSSLTNFTIPNTIIELENEHPDNIGVFTLCSKLTHVYFEEGSKCQKIGVKAFSFSGLQEISIPATVSEVSAFSFRSCKEMHIITVDSPNSNYKMIGKALCTSNDELVYIPPKAYDTEILQLPDGITRILYNAFVGITTYTEVTIPSSVQYLNTGAFYSFDSLKKITIPSSVKSMNGRLFESCTSLISVTFQNNPTNLYISMFENCKSLETFYIPESVNTISERCFYGCIKLKTVYVPNTVKTILTGSFSNCHPEIQLIFATGSEIVYSDDFLYSSNLEQLIIYLGINTEITIKSFVKEILYGAFEGREITSVSYENPENITMIQGSAFKSCTNLVSISLPVNIKNITQSMFEGCESLSTITIPRKVEYIEENAFLNCYKLGEVKIDSQNLLVVGVSSFSACSSLYSINLPDSVQIIDTQAFKQCANLTQFKLPSSLQSLGTNVFESSSITQFDIPQSSINLVVIPRMSFAYCTKLISFNVPDSVTEIQENAFSNCVSLQKFTIGTRVSTLGNSIFDNCEALESIEIPDNDVLEEFYYLSLGNCPKLTKIICNPETSNFNFDNGILFNKDISIIMLFLKATNPIEITIPSSVQYIYHYAFSKCQTLKTVTIEGEGIKEIGMCAFQSCSTLNSINFPQSLETIGSWAFDGCDLKSVTLINANITEIKTGTFSHNPYLKRIVLPLTIETIAKDAFSEINKFASLLYFGTKNIDHEIGLKPTSKVYCFDDYKYSTFVTFPISSFNLFCTKNSDNYSIFTMKFVFIFLQNIIS